MKKIATIAMVAMVATSCQQQGGYYDNKQTYQGAGLGAIIGATAGALSGKGSTDRRQKAMVGLAAGALLGGGYGAYMDKQEAELRRSLSGKGINIQRQGDQLVLTMPHNITFASGSSALKSGFKYTLRDVSEVLNHYNQTSVKVIGHTDSSGEASYNQNLSEKRASAVADVLRSNGVGSGRLYVVGAGESYPVASNETAAGKAQNRRVELQISPVQQKNLFNL